MPYTDDELKSLGFQPSKRKPVATGLYAPPRPSSPQDQEPAGMSPIKDYAIEAAQGVVGLGQAAYETTRLPFDALNIPSPHAALERSGYGPRFQETREILGQQQSPAWQAKERKLQEAEGFFDAAGKLVTDPPLLAGKVIESAPYTLALAGGTLAGAAKGGQMAAREAAKRIASRTGKPVSEKAAKRLTEAAVRRGQTRGGTAAAIGGNTALGGSLAAGDARDQIMSMDEADLSQNSPTYRALRQEGLDHEAAREEVARQGALRAAAVAGPLSGAATALTGAGRFESQALTGGLRRGVLPAAGGIVRESTEEALQEGGEQFGTNVGIARGDETQPLLANVPQAMGTGAVMGAAMGGGFKAVDYARSRRQAKGDEQGNPPVADSRRAVEGALGMSEDEQARAAREVAFEGAVSADPLHPYNFSQPYGKQKGGSKRGIRPGDVALFGGDPDGVLYDVTEVKPKSVSLVGEDGQTFTISKDQAQNLRRLDTGSYDEALSQWAGTSRPPEPVAGQLPPPPGYSPTLDAQFEQVQTPSLPVSARTLPQGTGESYARGAIGGAGLDRQARDARGREPISLGADLRPAPALPAPVPSSPTLPALADLSSRFQARKARQQQGLQEQIVGSAQDFLSRMPAPVVGRRQEAPVEFPRPDYGPGGAQSGPPQDVVSYGPANLPPVEGGTYAPAVRENARQIQEPGDGRQAGQVQGRENIQQPPPEQTGDQLPQQVPPGQVDEAEAEVLPAPSAQETAPVDEIPQRKERILQSIRRRFVRDQDWLRRTRNEWMDQGVVDRLQSTQQAVKPIQNVINSWADEFGLSPIRVTMGASRGSSGTWDKKNRTIGINIDAMMAVADPAPAPLHGAAMLEYLAHEFSHAIADDALSQADQQVQEAVDQAYNRWRAEVKGKGPLETMGDRSPAIRRTKTDLATNRYQVSQQYALSKEEWLADEGARYLLGEISSDTHSPLVTKAIKKVARFLRRLYTVLTGNELGAREVTPEMRSFLDGLRRSLRDGGGLPGPATQATETQQRIFTRPDLGEKVPPRIVQAMDEAESLSVGQEGRLTEIADRLEGIRFKTSRNRGRLSQAVQALRDAAEQKQESAKIAGSSQAEAGPGAAPKPEVAPNRLVSDERAAELRKRLKAKLNQLNSGIDPELIAIGTELAVYHIEKGARTFAAYARSMAADMDMPLSRLRPYLRSWYNGARDMMEDSGVSVEGMDSSDAVRAGLAEIDQEISRESTKPQDQKPALLSLAEVFRDRLLEGMSFSHISQARGLARSHGVYGKPGTPESKQVDEAVELGVVMAARQIVQQGRQEGKSDQAIYDDLVGLYKQQPNLDVRTSTSIAQQAYSTPVPIAYLSARLAGIDQETTVYEPTAGNGALLITADPDNVEANELNPERRANLQAQGIEATGQDATDHMPSGAPVDVVIANPPFGLTKDDEGQSRKFRVNDQYHTSEIDHAIALQSLEAMQDDGRAVLILGGVNEKAKSEDRRSDLYNAKAKREFYYTLYNQYNVVDHFTVSGSLYEKQGAGWPVDIIVIHGRGKSDLRLPAADVPRVYSSFDTLREVFNEQRVALQDQHQTSVEPQQGEDRSDVRADTSRLEQDEQPPVSGRSDRQSGVVGAAGGQPAASDDRGGLPDRGGQNVEPRDTDGQPNGVLNGPDGQPGAENQTQSTGSSRQGDTGLQSPRGGEVNDRHRSAGLDQGSDLSAKTRVKGERATEGQASYTPHSNSGDLGTLVPRNMQSAIDQSLSALEGRVGDIDAFVARELDYSANQLSSYFSAEQIDAIALALDNLARNAGFIIGDQTGIGKGRVVAAMIRYSLKQGKTPIFVTEKPNLYSDMYRDLSDIGMSDIRPLMTNAAEKVPLNDEGTQMLKTQSAGRHNALLQELGNKRNLGDYDVIFTTYSQMQTLKGARTPRMDFIGTFARGGFVIFDESHNAGGTEKGEREANKLDRAAFARAIARDAWAVFYSSATYAKRPQVMDLYFKTDMSLAVSNPRQLAPAISAGGVPMQQVVAAMLARAGQYIRRERSFDGVVYETRKVETDIDSYGKFSDSLKNIQVFSERFVTKAKKRIDREVKAQARSLTTDGSTGGAGVESTNFTSVMHNLIEQMLLAIKADAAVDQAIAALDRGEKPVITVANTMGSFIKDYADNTGISPGESVSLSFRDLLLRYLNRSREIIIKNYDGSKQRHLLTDDELGEDGTAWYEKASRFIKSMDIDRLPISPLDHIKSRIEERGLKFGEITGRKEIINYRSDGTATLGVRREADVGIAGRRKTIAGFNSGKLDVLLLNQAGSTGISLHASEKFKDQRKRFMIIAQAEKNIDTHMQMLGRIHRTGQVVKPAYAQLVADVPAEKRPAAVLAKKMASLNANTTANRKSALTAEDVPDILNEYGDEVVASILEDNPELHQRLGNPLRRDEDGLAREDAARKVTGRIPLLPVAEQESLYEQIEAEYRSLIERIEASGESPLEAKTLELDARSRGRIEIFAPKGNVDSPFADGAYAEDMDVKRLGKLFTKNQVLDDLAQLLYEEPAGERSLQDMTQDGQRRTSDIYQAAYQRFNVYQREVLDDVEDDQLKRTQQAQLDGQALRFESLLQTAHIGASVRLVTPGGNFYGVVMDITSSDKAKNPLALGQWKVKFYLADAARQMTIPISKLYTEETRPNVLSKSNVLVEPAQMATEDVSVIDAFDQMQSESRENRVIVTGNLLAGFSLMDNRGAIVNFTDDKSQIRQGILMPRYFDVEAAANRQPVNLETPGHVLAFINAGENYRAKSADDAVHVFKRGDMVRVAVRASKREGGRYYLNQMVLTAAGQDFVKVGDQMRVEVSESQAPKLIAALNEIGADLQATEHRDTARNIVGQAPQSNVRQSREKTPNPSTPISGTPEGLRDTLARELGAEGLSNLTSPGGPVRIINSTADLPEGLRSQIGSGGVVRGLYDPESEKAYLIAANIPPHKAQGILLHELGVHHGKNGIRGLVGAKAWDEIVSGMKRLRSRGNPLVTLAYDRIPEGTYEGYIDEEAIAYLVENSASHRLGPVRKLINRLRLFLRKIGILSYRNISPTEVVELARGAVYRASRQQYQYQAPQVPTSQVRTSPGGQPPLEDNLPGRVEVYTVEGQEPQGSFLNYAGRKARTVMAGTLSHGRERIDSPEDAAHLLAGLRREAQEVAVALVLDDQRRPIGVIRHTMGTTTGALIEAGILAGAVHSLPGAASVYLGHNHPSGDPTQSMEDKKVAARLEAALESTGIDYEGSIVVAPGGRATHYRAGIFGPGSSQELEIEPAARRFKTPVLERRFTAFRPGSRRPLDTVEAMAAFIKRQPPSGILLLDAQSRPAGFVGLSDEQMSELRTGEVGSGASRLYQALAATNASGIAVKSGDREAVDNLMSWARINDVELVDGFVNGESLQAKGEMPRGFGVFASRAEGGPLFSRGGPDGLDDLNGIRPPKDERPLMEIIRERFGDRLANRRTAWLGLLTRQQVVDIGSDVLPQARDFERVARRMDADRTEHQVHAGQLSDRWLNFVIKNRKQGETLADIMHRATLEGADPEKGEGPDSLRHDWNALPREAKDIYRAVREAYDTRRQEMRQALLNRVARSESNETQRRKMMEDIRLAFESRKVKGPYFPLSRFGDFWVRAWRTDGTGEPEFAMFESQRDQREAIKRLKTTLGDGWQIDSGKRLKDIRAAQGPSGDFITRLTGVVDKVADGRQAEQLKDGIYQLYLESLPELSVRKHFIHRKGRKGFSTDALRAFAAHMFHGSHQLARLNHSDILANHILQMRELAGKLSDMEERNKAADIVRELDRRFEWAMNPTGSAWAANATSIGFAWYLGITPAAAITNLTQTAIVAAPILGARYGFANSLKALGVAGNDYVRSRFSKSVRARIEAEYNGELGKALKEAEENGVIEKTLAHSLAGVSDTDTPTYRPYWQKGMQIVSKLFHEAERFNREATFTAAYRLAREKGVGHPEATEAATDAVWESHFDYSSANRSRYMQNDTAKILLLFKQYSQNMTYLLWRNLHQSLKGESKEVKREARTKLTGILGMTALFAGASGMPLMHLIFGTLNTLSALMGDDDEPWDAELAWRNFLADMFGATGGRIIAEGPVNIGTEALGAGVDIGSRVSLDQLWFRAPDRNIETKAMGGYWLEQMVGPLAGIGINFFRGVDVMEQGDIGRGLETMSPKAARDLLRTWRYATEGATSLRGDPIIEDFGKPELLAQALGLAPSRLAAAYDQRNALKRVEQSILNRRGQLVNDFAQAARDKDRSAIRESRQKIADFNRTNPTVKITAQGLRQALRARQRYDRDAYLGAHLDRRLRQQMMGLRFLEGT